MRSKLAMGGLIPRSLGVYRRLRRPFSLRGSYAHAPTRILIRRWIRRPVCGERVARALRGTEDVGVALVDRMNYTTFWPMVPSVIPSNTELRHVAHSLRRILRPLGIEYFQGEVTGVDFGARQVKTAERDLPYDYLVLAPGSRTTASAPQAQRELHGCERSARRSAGTQPRDRPLRGSRTPRRETPDDLLTFVIVGGGPTGVEAVPTCTT